jgi:hypothetical protein
MNCKEAVEQTTEKPLVLWLEGYKPTSLNRIIGHNRWIIVGLKEEAQKALRKSLDERGIEWRLCYTRPSRGTTTTPSSSKSATSSATTDSSPTMIRVLRVFRGGKSRYVNVIKRARS